MDDRTVRAALERHWAAPDAGDFNVEHEIYSEDAYPHLHGYHYQRFVHLLALG
jgi:hypothetical protein